MVTPLSSLWLLGGLLVALGGWPPETAAQAVAAKPVAPATVADTGGPAWRALTSTQRQNLAPLERDWPTLDANRKAKWLEVSSRFATMPVDEQQRVQARMADWAGLTPAERGQARLSFQEKKSLTTEQKQQRWEAYQALPDDHRRALAAKAQPVDDRKRGTAPTTTTPTATPSPTTAAAPTEGALAKRPVVSLSAASSAPATASSKPQVKPISPVMVQARPGATTTLINSPAVPPAHQLPGQPKIAAKPGQVDHKTLLPRSGPQAAASAAPDNHPP